MDIITGSEIPRTGEILDLAGAVTWHRELLVTDYDKVSKKMAGTADILVGKFVLENDIELDNFMNLESAAKVRKLWDFFRARFNSHEYRRAPISGQLDNICARAESSQGGVIPELNCVPLSLLFMEFSREFGLEPVIFGNALDPHLMIAFKLEQPEQGGQLNWLTSQFSFPDGSKGRVTAPTISEELKLYSGSGEEIEIGSRAHGATLKRMPDMLLQDAAKMYDHFLLIEKIQRDKEKRSGSQSSLLNFMEVGLVGAMEYMIPRKEDLAQQYWVNFNTRLNNNSIIFANIFLPEDTPEFINNIIGENEQQLAQFQSFRQGVRTIVRFISYNKS